MEGIIGSPNSKRRWSLFARIWLTFGIAVVCAIIALAAVFHQSPRMLAFLRSVFDLLPDLAAIFLAVLLAAVGIALIFLPEELKRMEERRRLRVSIAITLLVIGVVFGVGGVVSDLVQKHEETTVATNERVEQKIERGKLTDQITQLIGLQKLATTKEDLLQSQLNTVSSTMPALINDVGRVTKPDKPKSPDVSLSFVYPKTPSLMLFNQSDVVAREIKWAVVVWNADLPDRTNPFPIPFSLFDFLRPQRYGGPQDLFNRPDVAPLVKPSNRLFGSASVECPDCQRGRTFLVYIKWGEGGWYSELKNITTGSPYIPARFTKEALVLLR